MKNRYYSLLLLLFFLQGCLHTMNEKWTTEGVSKELAIFRKNYYKDVVYDLFFYLPENKYESIQGNVTIRLTVDKEQPVIIDFRGYPEQIFHIKLNDEIIFCPIEKEHIIIPPKAVRRGENTISISFIPDDQSLNRRDEFLYTLLVPDRARTLFPCFDQPDLKAAFNLTLDVPNHWQAIANSPVSYMEEDYTQTRKQITFEETEPLSTYLFSFVAGELKEEKYKREEREISVFHRETNPLKVSQCPEIASEVFDALDWLEEYTGIPYPFRKYDVIILPGFQYGGMEHTGATLYTDRRMFLNESPTLNERLSRSALIAHETAHMWFGDYVTMKWFDDVWTKEVFANYFASQIVSPLYPDINHNINFLLNYIPSAYSEDRTAGSNPVKQELDNLKNAGLVYGNIIYTKSPVVMEMLVEKMGEEAFQQGIREYLQTYAYNNATWEDLIVILDKYIGEDLNSWSNKWIHQKGMPEISVDFNDYVLTVSQSDPFEKDLFRPQELVYTLYSDSGSFTVPISLESHLTTKFLELKLPTTDCEILPNTNGKGYGFFRLQEKDARKSFDYLQTGNDEVMKTSLLISLHENMLNQTILPDIYIKNMIEFIRKEENPLLYSISLNYLKTCLHLYPSYSMETEKALEEIIATTPDAQKTLQMFRLYYAIASSPQALKELYDIWNQTKVVKEIIINENDYISLSYKLAIYLPEKADHIIQTQYSRITNPDRKQEYAFISPSVSPRKAQRDSVFNSLLLAENRRIEPWAATALSNLNHPAYQKEAVSYIRPSLEILEEVQRTGDIFFPTNWLRSLFSGHTSPEALQEVETFFKDHPNYHPMLSNKIRQQTDLLIRANSLNN